MELFRRLPEPSARDALAAEFLPLAEYFARRFSGRGEPVDDLTQTASLGLLNAIDRYDPERGVPFSTYAAATIVGELKRHFRDRGWALRVPRNIQETAIVVNRTVSSMWQDLGRAPTVAEIARAADIGEDDVLQALDALQAYTTDSLDAPVGDASTTTAESIGSVDPSFQVSDDWLSIAPALRDLPERERRSSSFGSSREDPNGDRRRARDLPDARLPARLPIAEKLRKRARECDAGAGRRGPRPTPAPRSSGTVTTPPAPP